MRIRPAHLSIALATAVGALLRSGVGGLLDQGWIATLLVNTVACLAAGLVVGSTGAKPVVRRIALVGLLGGLSTFATVAEELRRLLAAGDAVPAVTVVLVTVVACPIAFTIGRGSATR